MAEQNYQQAVSSRDAARKLLDRVTVLAEQGLNGGESADQAQAEEAFFHRENEVNNAWSQLLHRESQLRRLIGIDIGEGPLFSAMQQPFDGELILDWTASSASARSTRLELRQQQLRVESLQLQFRAADDLVQPQLDLVAGAQVNGFGDDILGTSGGTGYGSLFGGDNAGWNVGMEFSAPLRLREARTNRRHIEQRLAKARQVMHAQQQEVDQEIAYAFREIDRTYRSLILAQKQREAAARRQRAASAELEAGRSSVDLVLRAQTALTDAERHLMNSLVAYNKAIVELKYREGRTNGCLRVTCRKPKNRPTAR